MYRRLKPPRVIVFDNYHDVPLHSRFHDVLNDAVDEISAGVRIIIMSRNDPPPALAGLRARDRLDAFGASALRLTIDEMGRITRLRRKERVSKDTIRLLHQQTGGWAAGLTLVLESAAHDESIAPVASDSALEAIFGYFAKEVLERAEPEMQDFLLKSACLNEMTAGMAADLTETPRAHHILSTLVRRQYFTTRHLRTEPRYQYHPLFREFLLHRAEETLAPAEVVRVRRRAAALQAEAGQYEAAAAHLCALEDWDGMTRIIVAHGQGLWDQGRVLTLHGWLGSLPPERVEQHGWLQYWTGMCVLPFSPASSRAQLEQAFELFQAGHDVAGIFQAAASVVTTFLYAWEDFSPLDRWIDRIVRLLRAHPTLPSEEIAARVVSTLCGALIFRQPQHPEMGEWAERAFQVLRTSSDVNRRMLSGFMFTVYQCWMGQLGKAALAVNTFREVTGRPDCTAMALLAWGAARSYYYWHVADSKACFDTVASAMETARVTGVHVMDSEILGQGAAGALSAGDLAGAATFLRQMAGSLQGNRTLATSQYHFLRGWEAMLGADVRLAFEHVEAGLRLATEAGTPFPEALNHVAMAQVLRERGEDERAAAHLAKAQELARCTGSQMLRFMGLLLEASFAMEGGDASRGEERLRQALATGRQYGLVNTPFWRPQLMARLCVTALEAGIEVEYVQDLIRKRRLVPDPPPERAESWPWAVRVSTFGRFTLETDGHPIRFSGKVQQRPLAMLKALVAFGGEGVSEHQLADALWPDADGDAAHQSFKITLHRLRRLLANENAIALEGGLVSLNRQCCWVDAWAFERLLERADAADQRGQAAEMLRSTEKALVLYRGAFLTFDQSASWTLPLRERLHRRFLRAVARLARHWEDAGDWQKAIEWYERGLAVDELTEDFYRRQMHCYQRLGRQAEAVVVYQRCRRTLEALLGVAPSAETEALRQALKAP